MFEIREDAQADAAVTALLQAHVAHSEANAPETSRHSLSPSALRGPDAVVWGAWEGETLLGCAALKTLEPGHAEVKSMHVAEAHRGRGVSRKLLEHVIAEARRRAITRLSLETGSMAAYAPARALYAAFGFELCAPFGDYVVDPNSVFMTLKV